jgi:hypothetical protein
MEVLHCRGCGEKQFMSTRAIFHQQEYVEAVERFAVDHARCESYRSEDKARRALVWSRLVKIMGTRTLATGVTVQQKLSESQIVRRCTQLRLV